MSAGDGSPGLASEAAGSGPVEPHALADCLCLNHASHECQVPATAALLTDLTEEEAEFVRDALGGLARRKPFCEPGQYAPVARVLEALYWDLHFRAVGYAPERKRPETERAALLNRLVAATRDHR